MMTRYQVSAQAESDLDDIWEFLDAEAAETIADREIDRFHEQFLVLAEFPLMGRSRSDLAPGLRSFPVGSYIVLYRTTDYGVEIIRVRHARRRDFGSFPAT